MLVKSCKGLPVEQLEDLLDLVSLFHWESGAVQEGYDFEAYRLAKEFLKPYINLDKVADEIYETLLLGYPVPEERIIEEVERCERTYDSP